MKEELEYELDCLDMEWGHRPDALTVIEMLRQWSEGYPESAESP